MDVFLFVLFCRISPVEEISCFVSDLCDAEKRGTVVRKPVLWRAKHMARARGVLGKKSQG